MRLKGNDVCFVDGDDWVEPDFVEYMLELQAKRNADIVASLCCFTSTDFHQRTQDEVSTINPQEAMELFFYPTIELGAWNKLYSGASLLPTILSLFTDFCAGVGVTIYHPSGKQSQLCDCRTEKGLSLSHG